MDARTHLTALAELTAMTNEHANAGMTFDEKRRYEEACTVIADDLEGLPASEMAAKTSSAITEVMIKYNRGKATYERNGLAVPSFEDAVDLGNAMQVYDACMADE